MDLTVINTIWKPVYGKLVMGMRQLTPEWAGLRQLKNFTQLSPRSINWPVELVNGGGIAFTSDGGSTARASSNEPPEATDSWTHMVGRFEVGFDQLVGENAAKFTAQQIEKQVRYQAADKLRSFQRAVAIGFYGYPDAILFHATGSDISNPSGTITRLGIDSLYGDAGALASNFRIRDYLTINKDWANVKVAETAASRNATPGKVVAISEANDTIDLDSGTYFGASIVANDAIVLANQVLSGAADDLNLGFNGLLHLTRGATVHNISSSSQPDWVAGVDLSSYGSALSGADLYQWFEEIEQRSGHTVEWGYTTVRAIAAAGGAELDQRRYGADEDTMRLGFKKLNVMGVQVEGRPYVPSGHLFLGSSTAVQKIAPDEDVMDVVEMGDRAGGFKQYQDRLGFYKDQVMRSQMAAVSRLGLGVVSGVTENS
jgi:hypothetical protein